MSHWPHLLFFLSFTSLKPLWSLCWSLKTSKVFPLSFFYWLLQLSGMLFPMYLHPDSPLLRVLRCLLKFHLLSKPYLNYIKNWNPLHPLLLLHISFYHRLYNLLNTRSLFVYDVCCLLFLIRSSAP